MRETNNVVIGAYNCIHDVRTMFIYKCRTECSGYSIRKCHWKDILANYEEIAKHLIDNCTFIYETKIKKPMLKVKNNHIQRLAQRKDLSQILVIAPNTPQTHELVAQYKTIDRNSKTAFSNAQMSPKDNKND